MLLKTDNPLLSILIPAYTVEKYIQQCIHSILAQTFKNFEIIIADDASTDNTRQIIESFDDDRIIVSHNTVNEGKTRTVNRLLSLAKGKYITIHDSDDWSESTRFQKQIAWLEKDDNHIMCGTGYKSYDTSLKEIEHFKPLSIYSELKEEIKTRGQFHGPTMVFRKDALDENYIYREYFNDNYEDTDLAYRLFQKGICTNIQDPLFNYRILATSLCRNEFTIRNKHLYEVVVYLAKQREDYGEDDLMLKKEKLVEDFFDKITLQYTKDKGLIFREGAAYYMYWKYYKKSINYSFKAIRQSPFDLLNWRTLLYCVRKGMFS
jgi:glycosyltransferase involved in cell wall biosynthesis